MSLRALQLVGFVCLGFICAPCANAEELSLDEVHALLEDYRNESFCSTNCTNFALPALRKHKPGSQLLELFHRREILWLRGDQFGAFCVIFGEDECAEALLGRLDDPDPWWRVFSCAALGRLKVEGAVPRLLAMLDDNERLGEITDNPRGMMISRPIGDPPVAYFAAEALAAMGRMDGADRISDYRRAVEAETSKYGEDDCITTP